MENRKETFHDSSSDDEIYKNIEYIETDGQMSSPDGSMELYELNRRNVEKRAIARHYHETSHYQELFERRKVYNDNQTGKFLYPKIMRMSQNM